VTRALGSITASSMSEERPALPLAGKVAVVTGGSRGVGRGIALGLGDAGATVYVTGRTVDEGAAPLPGTIGGTAAEVTRRGGRGVAIRCDHRDDAAVEAVFHAVRAREGRLDVLVNNVFALPDAMAFNVPFWEQPLSLWDEMHSVGLRSHYVASVFAAPIMIAQGSGLIVNVSSIGGAGYAINVAYGVGKAGVDRLAADMAHELKDRGVAAVSLWPGIVKTERILALAKVMEMPFDVSRGESPELSGRAVVALAADPDVMAKTGQVLVVAELAEEYGFTDVDGSRPRSLRRPKG